MKPKASSISAEEKLAILMKYPIAQGDINLAMELIEMKKEVIAKVIEDVKERVETNFLAQMDEKVIEGYSDILIFLDEYVQDNSPQSNNLNRKSERVVPSKGKTGDTIIENNKDRRSIR